MNSVQEQCPISDSETVLSPKTRSKLSQAHRAPSLAQLAHTGAPRCARVAMSWRPQPAVSQAPAGCVVGAGHHVASTPLVISWLGCVVLRHSLASNSPPLVTIHLGVLQYKMPATSPLYDTIHLCVLQYSAHQPPQPQYTLVYCNTMAQPTNLPIAIQFSATAHPKPPCHDTMVYCNTPTSHSSPSLAIQFVAYKTRSQYNFIGQ